MEETHSIEVLMTPHYHDNKAEPYFWIIYEHSIDGKSNTGYCGWAKTPVLAWEKAHTIFEEKFDSQFGQ